MAHGQYHKTYTALRDQTDGCHPNWLRTPRSCRITALSRVPPRLIDFSITKIGDLSLRKRRAMASRLKLARAAAAVAGASVALMMTAVIPAGAEPASGRVDSGGDEYGYHVNLGKDYDDMSTGLIGFELADGTKLQMYCVEIDTGIDRKHGMVEQPWDSYPNPKSPFNDN